MSHIVFTHQKTFEKNIRPKETINLFAKIRPGKTFFIYWAEKSIGIPFFLKSYEMIMKSHTKMQVQHSCISWVIYKNSQIQIVYFISYINGTKWAV